MTYETIKELIGKIPVKIEGKKYDASIVFYFSDGTKCKFYHEQDCCEHVIVEDIEGEWEHLLNKPLLVAEECSNADDPPDYGYSDDSHTWTFYRFAVQDAWVVVRWLGESNGYYSETVSYEITESKQKMLSNENFEKQQEEKKPE